VNKKALAAVVVLALAVVLLALFVGGAASGNNGNGKHRGGHGSTPNSQTGYHFLVLDAVAGMSDRLIIQGDGSFNANRAHGGGTFDHFRAVGSAPLPLVASGTWKATDVVSFHALTPTHGVYEGGALIMHATFFPNGQAPISNVLIEVDCNLGPAGVSTGKPEGVVVTVPSSPALVFAPTSPTTGVTVFSLAKGEQDDDGD
jgi:hypothetical protein